jgi:pimeloyl-ACP methyl ester carboxylesterase
MTGSPVGFIALSTAATLVALAYRHYTSGPTMGTASARRVVLVHGSSASSRSMHPMAQALATAGYMVDALDVRGHGDSGTRGHLGATDVNDKRAKEGYIGQLEDDLADRYAATFADAGNAVPITLVPGANHMGLTLNASAPTTVVAACKD